MSNKLLALKSPILSYSTFLFGDLSQQIIDEGGLKGKLVDFLTKHCSFGVQKKSNFLDQVTELKSLKLFSDFRKCINSSYPASKIDNYTYEFQEYDLLLAIFDLDSTYYKKRLSTLCKRLRITPEKLLTKLLFKYESADVFPLLPVEIGRVLARPELSQKIFETNFDSVKIKFLASYGASDDKVLASFILGDVVRIKDEKGIVAKVVNGWLKRDFSEVVEALSGIEKLIESGKIKKTRFNYILVLFHVLSLIKEERPTEARKLLAIYQNFLGINTLLRVLDICLDFQAGNIKRTKTKLKHLTFGLRGDRSEVYFRNLAYFWIADEFTEKELFQLKSLREEASLTDNKFIFSEIDALIKKKLGADALLNDLQSFPNMKLCELFDSNHSWEELLSGLSENIRTRKLVWLVRLDSGSELQDAWCEIEPAVAEINSKGKMSKPKFIGWPELLKVDSPIEKTVQDERVLSLVERTSEEEKLSYHFPESRALSQLSKAENVYLLDEPSQKVSILKRSPEVEIDSFECNFQIQWAFPTTFGNLYVKEVDDFKFEVCCLNDSQAFLREKLSSGLTLEKDYQKLKDFTDSIQSNVLIKGDGILQEKTIKNGSRTKILCRFNPSGVEYKLEILAQSDWGYETTPGYGRTYITEKLQGKTFEWLRDLKSEKVILERVLSEIDFEKNLESNYEIYDRQHLLEILEKLNAIEELKIEWPKDLKVSAHKYSSGILSVKASENKDWFHIEGKLKFGEVVVKLASLLEKMNKKSRFVELSENEYLILTDELRSQLTEVGQLVDQRDECLLLHSSLAEQFNNQLNGVPVDLEEDFLFKDAITRALYAKNEKVELSQNFGADLRPYQKVGFEWMAKMTAQGIGVCLADDMGLGKTIQTLALLSLRAQEGPSLVVAPTSLCTNWCSEGRKFSNDLRFINYSGQDRQSFLASAGPGDVLVVSYNILIYDCDFLCETIWNTLVLDEAQMIKNSGTLRSKSIRLIQSRNRLALSGTPLENHTGELWNIFDILNPGLLGTRAAFNKNFALPIERGDKEAVKKLRARVKPFLLRRLRKNVLNDLPESQECILYVDLAAEEKDLYDAHRYKAIKNLKKYRKRNQAKPQKRIEILAEITRLRVAAANPQIVDEHLELSNKSSALINKLINLSENGHKTLIFSQFVSHLDIIQNLLFKENISFSRLDGSMNQKVRQKAIDAFSEEGVSCMLISLKAGGVGLNLTMADHVIHMDPWWNPAVEDQAIARAVRIGQKSKVNIIRFISKGTIEEDIIKLHENKRELADDLLKGTHAAAKLSVEDLMDLIEKNKIS